MHLKTAGTLHNKHIIRLHHYMMKTIVFVIIIIRLHHYMVKTIVFVIIRLHHIPMVKTIVFVIIRLHHYQW